MSRLDLRRINPPDRAIGLRPYDLPGGCCWDACRNDRSVIFPFNLCDDHAVLIHDIVAEQQASRMPLKVSTKQRDRRASEAKTQIEALGWVYYLRVDDKLKIGFASNLRKRLHQYPPTAVLMAAHPGTKEIEQALHASLTASRRVGREWYAFTEEITALLKAVHDKHGAPTDPRTWTKSNAVRRNVPRAGGGLLGKIG